MTVETAGEAQLYADIVDAINDIYGVHPGRRAVHAKGTLCAGTFTASPAAAPLSRAAHLQGEPVRAHVRFSNGGGDPGAHDGRPDGRGLAVKLYLTDGTTTDIVGITLPVFFVRTPEDFLEFTRARKPDPETGAPNLELVGAFLQAHPETVAAVQAALAMKPPVSYLQCAYNGLHSFRLRDPDGEARWVRFGWTPEEGEADLEPEQAMERDPDYLRADLESRLAEGPAAFELVATVAADGDPIDDPTAAWPNERDRIVLGRLEVTGLAFDRERGDDVLVFDPTRLTDGIEPSADPILHARRLAYAESVYRRSGARLTAPERAG
jgi:catalase